MKDTGWHTRHPKPGSGSTFYDEIRMIELEASDPEPVELVADAMKRGKWATPSMYRIGNQITFVRHIYSGD